MWLLIVVHNIEAIMREFFNHSVDNNNYGLVSYRLKNTLSEFGSVSRGVCKVSNGKLDSINEHLKWGYKFWLQINVSWAIVV